MNENRRALVVANFEYQDPILRRLASPPEDAKELAAVLRNPGIGGFEVETLLNETAARVSQKVEEFFVFSDSRPDDLLLLYFSGHGVTDEEGKLYFATADTQFVRHNVRRATAVGADFVDAVMRRSRSRRQIGKLIESHALDDDPFVSRVWHHHLRWLYLACSGFVTKPKISNPKISS